MNPTGTHNYEIQKTGTGQWTSYYDFTAALTISGIWDSSRYITVGLETSDTANTFTSPATATSIEYLDASGWHLWTGTPSSIDTPNNPLGWKSTFNYNATNNTNSITFTHQ